jgi:hypothetical protein
MNKTTWSRIFVLKVVSRMTSLADPTTAAVGLVLARKRYVVEKNVWLTLEEQATRLSFALLCSYAV